MADEAASDRSRHRATRRQVIVGGTAALTAGSTAVHAACPLTGAAATDPAGSHPATDETILDLERQAHAASAEWYRASDLFAEAERACWAVLDDADADDFAKADAETRLSLASAEESRLAEAVDDLALKICEMPAESLPGLACKARVALWLKIDGLAELVLRDLVRFAGGSRG